MTETIVRVSRVIDQSGTPQPGGYLHGRPVYLMTELEIRSLGRLKLFGREISTTKLVGCSTLLGLAISQLLVWFTLS